MTLRPSLEGFIRFVRDDMKVPVHAIADDDPTLECCFQSAMELIPHDQGLERLPEYGDGIGYFLKDAIDQKYVKLPFIYSYATTVIQK
ncbi:TPA: hypothetical protein JXS38_004351 [Escherichia coli]|nr:hypothetical protein [Escherichia coli]